MAYQKMETMKVASFTSSILIEGEIVELAYQSSSEEVVFTNKRVIVKTVERSRKKKKYRVEVLPYKAIEHFTFEMSDDDASDKLNLNLMSGSSLLEDIEPITFVDTFTSSDMEDVQRVIAINILQ